jgi:hypothetical protein
MVKGHLVDQVRQNGKSTKLKQSIPTDTDTTDDYFPLQVDKEERTHCCYLADMAPTGQIYTDQTGKFVAPSSNGNNYQLICYDYDSNAILAVAFKNQTATCIKTAFQEVHRRLCKAGLRPAFHRLDNECSDILKQFLQKENIDYQTLSLATIAAILPNAPFVHGRITASGASPIVHHPWKYIYFTKDDHVLNARNVGVG